MNTHEGRTGLSELRLSTFKSHRNLSLPLGSFTLFTGPSGSGKTSALQAYGVLARLGAGAGLAEAFAPLAGGAVGCIPHQSRPDAGGRRGLRIGCTISGPLGEVRLDAALQAEPELRIVGERLTADGRILFSSALRDPGRRQVQGCWRTAGSVPVTRAPLPDDRLGTALLPLRVAGRTDGEREVLAAAEQVVVALRSVYSCDPRPSAMRAPTLLSAGELNGDCGNLAAVLGRVRAECGTRHALLVEAVRAGCAGPVTDVVAEPGEGGSVTALLERGAGLGRTPVAALGDGELRYLALALVLLTGPGVLAVDPASEVLPARQTLTVIADGLDRCLDGRQKRELMGLAARMCERGQVRLIASVSDEGREGAEGGISVVDLGA